MKKRLLAIFLCALMAASITACGENDDSDTADSNSSASSQNESSADTGSVEEASDLKLWANKETWGEKSDKSPEWLFCESLTLPIDLSEIDDSYHAPYRAFIGDNIDTDTLSDILSSDQIIKSGGELDITTQLGTTDEMAERRENGTADYISWIYIKNYSDSDLSIKECYENGWWYIDASYFPERVLGFGDIEDIDSEYDYDNNAETLLNEYLEAYGAPSYITTTYASGYFEKNVGKSDGALFYSLVYEYDDYVISILVQDQIVASVNEHIVGIPNVAYYPKTCWENVENSDVVEID